MSIQHEPFTFAPFVDGAVDMTEAVDRLYAHLASDCHSCKRWRAVKRYQRKVQVKR